MASFLVRPMDRVERHWIAEQEFYRRLDHPQRTWYLSGKVHEVLSRSIDEVDYWFSELLVEADGKGIGMTAADADGKGIA